MNARTEPAEAEPATPVRPPTVRQLLLVAGLFLVYRFGRRLAATVEREAPVLVPAEEPRVLVGAAR